MPADLSSSQDTAAVLRLAEEPVRLGATAYEVVEGMLGLYASAPGRAGSRRLAETFPDVDLVPIYLENLHRSMPKGKHVPLPIICTIRIGNPMLRVAGEEKQVFLERARDAIVRLSK